MWAHSKVDYHSTAQTTEGTNTKKQQGTAKLESDVRVKCEVNLATNQLCYYT